jgi:hypothetical protein
VLPPKKHILISAEFGDVFLEPLPIELAIHVRWWSFLSQECLRKGSPVFEPPLLTKVNCERSGNSPSVKLCGVVGFLRWWFLDCNLSKMIRKGNKLVGLLVKYPVIECCLPIRLSHLKPHKRLIALGATPPKCDNRIGRECCTLY